MSVGNNLTEYFDSNLFSVFLLPKMSSWRRHLENLRLFKVLRKLTRHQYLFVKLHLKPFRKRKWLRSLWSKRCRRIPFIMVSHTVRILFDSINLISDCVILPSFFVYIFRTLLFRFLSNTDDHKE